jgi:hypothetical protein
VNYKDQIRQLLSKQPGLRTIQLCDKIDLSIDQTKDLLDEMVTEGTLKAYEVDSPAGGGRKATAYDLIENERGSEAARPTYAVRASAFIQASETKSATSAELHTLFGLNANEYASSYLIGAVRDGRLVKDGKTWTLGSADPQPQTDGAESAPGLGQSQAQPAAAVVVPKFVTSPEPAPARPVREKRAHLSPAADPEQRDPVYRCCLWSDGILEVQKDGKTVAALEQAAGESLRCFLGRLAGERAAA